MSLSTYFVSHKSYWLRWIGILPISIATYFLSYATVNVLNYLSIKLYGDISDDGWLVQYIIPAFATGVAAYYFIEIGVKIAPRYKKVVSLILFIISCMWAGTIIFVLIRNGKFSASWFELIGHIIGSVSAFWFIYEDKRHQDVD